MYVDNYNAREKVTQWTGQASTACLCGRTIFKWEKTPQKNSIAARRAYLPFPYRSGAKERAEPFEYHAFQVHS